MAKGNYRCTHCGYRAVKWVGRCPSCGQWGSMEEEDDGRGSSSVNRVVPVKLGDVESGLSNRLRLSSSQLNGFFGGGLVEGSVILVSGEPGIGKSTLLLQLPRMLSSPAEVLYVSGEETVEQVSSRAKRLKVEDVWFVSTQSLEDALGAANSLSPKIVIVDSVQTIRTQKVEGVPGSVHQVRAVAEALVEYAKTTGAVVFLVGHVTKSGAIAGPKLLEHVVDVVLYLEGDRRSPLRILKSVKNRFGPTSDVVLFEMTTSGLREVENPSAFLVDASTVGKPGVVLSSVVEGTRAIMVEVQALVAPSIHPAASRRVSSMFDIKRLFFLMAVMEKHLGISFSGMDVYVNIPGGLMVRDTAVDLAVVAAIYSSFVNRGFGKIALFVGEVGLAGEVRWVRDLEARLKEASSMGAEVALIPASFKGKIDQNLDIIPVSSISEALEVFGP